MDSAKDSGHLTDQLIAELAASAVSAKDAKSLVQRFMALTAVRVSNMQFDADNAVELTSSLFRTWRNQSKETNKIKVSFFTAVPVFLASRLKSFCHWRKLYFLNCCCSSTGPGLYSLWRTWSCRSLSSRKDTGRLPRRRSSLQHVCDVSVCHQ